MATATLKAKLTLNDSLFQAGIKRATAAAKKLGGTIAGIGAKGAKVGLAAVGAGVVGAGVAMVVGTKRVIDLGDELLRMKRITGISVSSLFVLREAFEQAGTGSDMMAAAVGKMQRTIFEANKGTGAMADQLAKLGLPIAALRRLRPEDQFLAIGKAIDALPDMKKQATAMAIFGKAGLGLLPVFAELKDFDSGDLKKQAALIEANADAFDNANDAIRRAKTTLQGFFVGTAVFITPIIAKLGQLLTRNDFVKMGIKFAAVLKEAAVWIITAIKQPLQTIAFIWALMKNQAANFVNWFAGAFLNGMVWAINKIGDLLEVVLNGAINAMLSVMEKAIRKIPGMGDTKLDREQIKIGKLKGGFDFTKPGSQLIKPVNADALKPGGLAGARDVLNKLAKKDDPTKFVNPLGEEIGKKFANKANWREMFSGPRSHMEGLRAAGAMGGPMMMGGMMGVAGAAWQRNDAIDKYGTGNWRSKRGFGTLQGAGGLDGAAPLQKWGMLGAGGGTPGSGALRSSGMVNSAHKRRVEAFERGKAAEGIDKTNDLLTEIKKLIPALE